MLRQTDNISYHLIVSMEWSPTITQNVGYITETRSSPAAMQVLPEYEWE